MGITRLINHGGAGSGRPAARKAYKCPVLGCKNKRTDTSAPTCSEHKVTMRAAR